MLGVACHGQKDVRVEGLAERPLGADEVRVAVGAFRARAEFQLAVKLIVSGEVDVLGTLS